MHLNSSQKDVPVCQIPSRTAFVRPCTGQLRQQPQMRGLGSKSETVLESAVRAVRCANSSALTAIAIDLASRCATRVVTVYDETVFQHRRTGRLQGRATGVLAIVAPEIYCPHASLARNGSRTPRLGIVVGLTLTRASAAAQEMAFLAWSAFGTLIVSVSRTFLHEPGCERAAFPLLS